MAKMHSIGCPLCGCHGPCVHTPLNPRRIEMGEKMTLLPCPFCGSQPKLHTSSASDERSGYNFTVSVRCQCGAKISKPSHEGKGGWCDDKGEAKEEVISSWNTRHLATPAQTVDDVEACGQQHNPTFRSHAHE